MVTVSHAIAKYSVTELLCFRGQREISLRPTDRQSCNMFGNIERSKVVPQTAKAAKCLGAQRSQALPQTARPAKCSGPQRGPKWPYRPQEPQNIWGHSGPKRFHRPLDLQDIRDHRVVPSGTIEH